MKIKKKKLHGNSKVNLQQLQKDALVIGALYYFWTGLAIQFPVIKSRY